MPGAWVSAVLNQQNLEENIEPYLYGAQDGAQDGPQYGPEGPQYGPEGPQNEFDDGVIMGSEYVPSNSGVTFATQMDYPTQDMGQMDYVTQDMIAYDGQMVNASAYPQEMTPIYNDYENQTMPIQYQTVCYQEPIYNGEVGGDMGGNHDVPMCQMPDPVNEEQLESYEVGEIGDTGLQYTIPCGNNNF
jgi:hypothetical protein